MRGLRGIARSLMPMSEWLYHFVVGGLVLALYGWLMFRRHRRKLLKMLEDERREEERY